MAKVAPRLSQFWTRETRTWRLAGGAIRKIVVPLLLTAGGYGLVGWFSLRLANPASHAAPLFPAAGLALACALVYGWPAALGTMVASAGIVAATLIATAALPLPLLVLVASGIGVSSGLQALIGSWLVRRWIAGPLILSETRDIALFFSGGAVVACLISASIGSALLAHAGLLPPALGWATWTTWWLGNVLGVIVGAPIALGVIGRPRSEWRPRRLAVGLTLTAAILLLAVGILQISRLEAEWISHRIDHEGGSAVAALRSRLQDPLRALDVTRGIFLASSDVTQREMHRAAQQWLYPPGRIIAVGWGESTAGSVRAAGMPANSGQGAPPAAEQPASAELIVRYVEPLEGNAPLLGTNLLVANADRRAVVEAIETGTAVASEATGKGSPDRSNGEVTLYAPVYGGPEAAPDLRAAELFGVVFVTFSVEETVAPVLREVAGRMSLCLVDRNTSAGVVRLAGAAACERDARAQQVHALTFAGRSWEVLAQSPTGALAGMPSQQAWLFSVAGLLSAGLLSALLLMLTGRALRIEQAVADRTQALLRQIREREQAEAALREGEQRFRNIFDNVSIGVVYADLEGVIREVNSRYATLVGCTVEALIGTQLVERIHPEDRAESRRQGARLIAGRVPIVRGQLRILRQDGSVLWVQQNLTLLRDIDGAPQHLVGVVEDISDQFRLVEAERAREAAEAANRAKSDFLSRMSHELRTPLNAMLGFAQLLGSDRQQPLSESQQVQVAQIQQAGWHLLEMINDVLDLSRVDSDNLRLQPQALQLQPLVDAAWTLVAGEATRKRLGVSRDLAEDAALIQGDATRVKQILTNLLSNAVKYNVDDGRVALQARRAGSRVEITVSDSGPGMTPEQLDGLFQPFNRLGRERSNIQGTGIGLVISRRLAELMGGTLEARSRAGRGSSFILSLPGAGAGSLEDGAAPQPPVGDAGYHRRIVHYVEDNATNVEVMRGILAQRPQVQFVVSVTGLDGLAAIRAQLPDVILLDMHLPDIDGLELLRHLKDRPETRRIPVIVVSADALSTQIDRALDAGAAHYLTKPVDIAELLRLLDSVLEASETRY